MKICTVEVGMIPSSNKELKIQKSAKCELMRMLRIERQEMFACWRHFHST